jgi:GNAT superfamily N-acetyltransferase
MTLKTYMKDNLVYKEIVFEDINLISNFLNKSFESKKFTYDYLYDIYFKNDSVLGFNIFHDNIIIAHYCVVKRTYSFDSSTICIGWSINTAVAKEYRGSGFFEDLATKTYKLAKKNGVKAIVGVANRKSTRLFIKKLGFIDKGNVRMNLDLLNIYKKRTVFPTDFNHNFTKTIKIFGNRYLFKNPFIKVYSDNQYSILCLYLTSRKSKFCLGITLPQNWFKSNWQVIILNLSNDDKILNDFINDFSIDILESDTF